MTLNLYNNDKLERDSAIEKQMACRVKCTQKVKRLKT